MVYWSAALHYSLCHSAFFFKVTTASTWWNLCTSYTYDLIASRYIFVQLEETIRVLQLLIISRTEELHKYIFLSRLLKYIISVLFVQHVKVNCPASSTANNWWLCNLLSSWRNLQVLSDCRRLEVSSGWSYLWGKREGPAINLWST